MQRRLATLILIVLTLGFFVFHYWEKLYGPLIFVDTISPNQSMEDRIVYNEFLILMDQGDEKYIDDVLTKYDLDLISPLGEWLLVAKREAYKTERIVSINSPEAKENQQFLRAIEAHGAVHSATLNFVQGSEPLFSCGKNNLDDEKVGDQGLIPDDPYFRYQWHLSKETGINLPGAWAITTGDPRTVIAVVDRNFDVTDPEVAAEHCLSRHFYYENILQYFPIRRMVPPQDQSRHGTYVLGVLAPCTDNEAGLAGIDWRAQVFSVDSKSDASFSARMFGMLWAAGFDVCSKSITDCPERERFRKNHHPANVINASFGFAGAFLKDPPYGPVLDVIGLINRRGGIVVASTGNESDIADLRLPGSAGGVISVGASNKLHQSASFSNFGHTVDVVAPGENILALRRGQPISLNGTSFASPIVAGVVSLMLARNPELSWKQVEYILKATATPMTCEDYCPNTMNVSAQRQCQNYCCDHDRVICAAGIVDAKRAVQMATTIPKTALVDVDDYYLALSKDNGYEARVVIKNWGKKASLIRAVASDHHIKIVPEVLTIGPLVRNGEPKSAEMIVYYDTMPKNRVIASVSFEAANIDQPQIFLDQIEAIVEIVPDVKKD